MVYNIFDKKASGGAPKLVKKSAVKYENTLNKELAEELHKFFRTFKKRKVHSPFIDNIWSVDLADMQLTNNCNKGSVFDYVLLIFSANTQGLFL